MRMGPLGGAAVAVVRSFELMFSIISANPIWTYSVSGLHLHTANRRRPARSSAIEPLLSLPAITRALMTQSIGETSDPVDVDSWKTLSEMIGGVSYSQSRTAVGLTEQASSDTPTVDVVQIMSIFATFYVPRSAIFTFSDFSAPNA